MADCRLLTADLPKCSPFTKIVAQPFRAAMLDRRAKALRYLPSDSLVMQRLEGIDQRRAAGRDVAGEKGDDGQQQCGPAEGCRIVRSDAVQDGCHGPRERKRAHESQRQADGGHAHGLPEDKLEYVAPLRAERHPDAELACSLANTERDDSVETRSE